jgi:hypothetical protein
MIDALSLRFTAPRWAVIGHRRSAVRIPAGPPLTVIAGCDVKDRPSKLKTWMAFSFMHCTRTVR